MIVPTIAVTAVITAAEPMILNGNNLTERRKKDPKSHVKKNVSVSFK